MVFVQDALYHGRVQRIIVRIVQNIINKDKETDINNLKDSVPDVWPGFLLKDRNIVSHAKLVAEKLEEN